MNDVELRKMILTRLGRGVSHDNVILEVCQQGALGWPEAEELVQQVAVGQAGAVARRQSPVILILSVSGFVVGLAWAIWIGTEIYAFLSPYVGSRNSLNPMTGVSFFADFLRYYLPAILGALGLCIGGMAGIITCINAWRAGD